MSRIGKRPVAVPSGVTATVDGQIVKMKGPKGQLQFVVHNDVEVKFENGQVKVAPRHETNRARALYGTARAQTGIRPLLHALEAAGLDFIDLQTKETSLEEIFVDIVRAQA